MVDNMENYNEEKKYRIDVIKKQWNIICLVASIFEKHDIEYHFDASTAAFVHGVNFEMSDIDIVIIHDCIDKVIELLKPSFELTELEYMPEHNLDYFFAVKDGQKLHCLFYRDTESDYSTFYGDVEKVVHDGQQICTKTFDFYLKQKKIKHYLNKMGAMNRKVEF